MALPRSDDSGEPLAPQTLTSALKRHLTVAGLPAIQARLGHGSTTTLNIYGHLMPSAFQGVGERVDAILEGNTKATEVEVAAARLPKPASALVGSESPI